MPQAKSRPSIDRHMIALEILNLTADATFEDARAAYKKSRKELHPDQYMDKPHLKAVAEEALKKVNDAWDFLKRNQWSGKYSSTAHATAKKTRIGDDDPSGSDDPDSDSDDNLPPHYFRDGGDLYFLPPLSYVDPIFVCGGNFDVVANVVNDAKVAGIKKHFYLLQFQDGENNLIQLKLRKGATQKNILDELRDAGLKVGKNGGPRLFEFIRERDQKRRLISIATHWYGKCYLTTTRTIGPPGAENLILDPSFEDVLEVKGTAESWRQTLGRYSSGNQLMTFAASIGFASVVLRPLVHQTCLGFHFWGISSIGKSTAANVCRSVTGSNLLVCKASDVGTEEDAYRHNDTSLVLDEIEQASPDVFWRAAYTIGNGRAAGKHGSKRLSWILAWISSGEISFTDFGKLHRLPPIKEGQEVRLISIPAAIGPFGSFNTIHKFGRAELFADAITASVEQNQGAIILEFLEFFTRDYGGSVLNLKEKIAKFVETEQLNRADLLHTPAWVRRILKHFAIVAAAGELATEFGTTGWPTGWATLAASKEFALWYETEYTASARIEDGALQVFDWIGKNKSRIEFEIEKGRTICWMDVDNFRKACAPFDYQMVARELRRQGKLVSEKDGHLTRRRRNGPVGPGDRPHFFCVTTTGDSGDIGDGFDGRTDTSWASQPPLTRQEPDK